MLYKRGIIVLISIFFICSVYQYSVSSSEAKGTPNMKRSMVSWLPVVDEECSPDALCSEYSPLDPAGRAAIGYIRREVYTSKTNHSADDGLNGWAVPSSPC